MKPLALAPELRLRQAGLRRTPVRLGVLELLGAAKRPLSAQQILERLPECTDEVTVYRTLNTLTEKGFLHRVRGDDGVWRFATEEPDRRAGHHHAHFVCDGCGTVECLKDTPLPKSLAEGMEVGKGYDVSYSELVLHGVCPKCQK